MKISVIGCGYLGAVHAAAMAELGHEVVGIDVDAAQDRSSLAAARRRSSSPGCRRSWRRRSTSGRLRSRPTWQAPPARRCTSSPSAHRRRRASNAADLTYVDAAIDALIPHLPGVTSSWASRRCRSGPPRGSRERHRGLGAGRSARLEPRVPARGLRREGHASPPTGSSTGCRRRRRRAVRASSARRGVRDARSRADTPLVVDRLRDRRAREGRGERVPGHEDLASSTRWPRSPRSPAQTSRSSPTRSATTPGSAAGS